jgi:two-component sensor histidine kinase
LKNFRFLFLTVFRRRFSLVAALFLLLIAGCREKQQKTKALIHKAGFGKADSLIRRAESYMSTRPDSLSVIADQLLGLSLTLENDSLMVRAERYKAKSLWNQGNHSQAMEAAIRALQHAENKHVNSEIPEIYAIIGHLHKEKNNYKMAFDAVDKGLAAASQFHDTSSIIYINRLRAMFTQGLGANKKDTSLIIKSLFMHLEGVKLAEVSDKFEKSRISYYNNIAQAYVKLKKLDKASYYVNKAIALAIKHNQQYSLTFSYNWLAQIYANQGDRQNAVKYMLKSLQITKDMKYSFREMEVNGHFYDILNDFGDYKAALQRYTRYSELRDSLRVLENVRQVGELQIQYEAEKKDKQIMALGNLNKNLVKQTAEIWSVLGVFFLLLLGILYQFRINLKKNESLAIQNKMINAQAEKMRVLMNELHHRVKNNLQVVSNLLSLQVSRVADEDSKSIIRSGQQRIEAMSLIHKSLYNYEEVNKVNMKEYLAELIESIMQSFGIDDQKLALTIICEVQELDIDVALPLGLIINEWVTNAFKHAYGDTEKPRLSLAMNTSDTLNLLISDNGKGIDLSVWNHPKGSFGVKLVKVLVRQLNGDCRVYSDQGTRFELKIPVKKMAMAGLHA